MIEPMQPHILRAHSYWKEILGKKDTVIDATCGNGYDTFFLAQLLGEGGKVIAYDIQKEAIEMTRERVQGLSVELRCTSHENFPERAVKLIVYNLGYLPGGNKSKTTLTTTTLKSVKNGLEIADYLSITCYPGHAEGAREEALLLQLAASLPTAKWLVCHHKWLNRTNAPTLLWMQRLAPQP